MQALSNGAPAWNPKPLPVSIGPMFAQANPHGLPFDYCQAAATNSDAFKYSPSAGEPEFATATSDNMFADHQPNAPMHFATDKPAKR